MTTFFTDPEAAGGGEFLDTAEVGIRFTLPAGTINSFRVYWPAVAPGGTPVVNFWNAGGTLSQTVSFDTTTLSAWNSATPTTPIVVSAGTYYVSWGTTRYKAITGFFAGGSVTRGSITAVEGRFASVGSFPSSTSSAAYVVDLDFTASGGGSTVNGAATATSASTLTAAAAVVRPGAAATASVSSLTATASVVRLGQAALGSASTITATASARVSGAATLGSVSTVVASTLSAVPGTAAVTSTSALTATATSIRLAAATPASTSSLTATAILIIPVGAAAVSASALTAGATLLVPASAALGSASALAAYVGSVNQPGALAATVAASKLVSTEAAARLTSSQWP